MKRKILPLLLIVSLLATQVTAFAKEPETEKESYKLIEGTIEMVHMAAISDVGVKDVKKSDNMLGIGQITIKIKHGSENADADLIVGADTFITTGAKGLRGLANSGKTGQKIFGYYNANAPMITIYPPQYKMVAVGLASDTDIPAVAVFDKNMLAKDNSLKLNMSDDVKVVDVYGEKYTGSLVDKLLLVEYRITTMSLPPQTNPEKIVVLNTKVEAPTTPEVPSEEVINYDNLVFMIDGKKIDGQKAYANNAGMTMVPVRAIAEALGYKVSWDKETSSVLVGITSTLSVGKDYYTFAKMAPFTLGHVPELVDGVTYVPLTYFKQVLRLNNAYVLDGQVVIDNKEEMK